MNCLNTVGSGICINNIPDTLVQYSMQNSDGGVINQIFALDKKHVYIGGQFSGSVNNVTNSAYIVMFNGTSFKALISNQVNIGKKHYIGDRVYTVSALDPNNVYIGGMFGNIGSSSSGYINNTGNIVRWDESNSTWNPLGVSVNGSVFSIFALDATHIYVGGQFNSAGGVANTNRFAMWNGSSWKCVNTLINSSLPNIVKTVHALNDNLIYIQGDTYVKKWDGTNIVDLANSITGSSPAINTIFALDENHVYVGGFFATIGGVSNTRNIAMWNGSSWKALSTGLNNSTGDSVYSIYAVSDTQVYVSGRYSGGMWNGTAWKTIPNMATCDAVGAIKNARSVYYAKMISDGDLNVWGV